MIAINDIKNGLNLASDKHYQPPGTVTANHNGDFIHYEEGSFNWRSSKGMLKISITLNEGGAPFNTLGITILAMDFMRNNLIILGIDIATGLDYVGKIVFTKGNLTEAIYYHLIDGDDLGFDIDNPIRQFFCLYENENYQRIYWNDGNESPRSLNIADIRFPINKELLNFTPIYKLGQLGVLYETTGNITCGSYSLMFRLITSDGTPSNFSLPTNPIPIRKKKSLGEFKEDEILNNKGANYTETSNIGLRLEISGIDTDFDRIQVVSFRSIAEDVYEPGITIFDSDITGSVMEFTYAGGENLGTVTTEELNISTRFILKTQLMEFTNNLNTLGNFEQKAEIPEGDIIKYNKINGVTLDKTTYPIPLDSKVDILEDFTTSDSDKDKPLGVAEHYPSFRYKGVWYRNSVSLNFTLGDGITSLSSEDEPFLRIPKYNDALGNTIYKDISLVGEYLNYKGTKVCEHLRGYMGTETYRYGAVLFKDGKQYGVRWIGDKEFPIRTSFWKMATANLYPEYTDHHLMANVMNLIVNNLDLTELVTTDGGGNAIDCAIDGFAIVRCKRDVTLISQGVLTAMAEAEDSGNRRNVQACPSTAYAGDGLNKDRMKYAYTYYSPDILFSAEGKEITAGDTLRVHTYFGAWSDKNSYFGWEHVNGNNWAQKYYFDTNQADPVLPADGTENLIRAVYDWGFNAEGLSDLSIIELGKVVRNESETPGTLDGYGCDTKILVLENDEPDEIDSFASFEHNYISIVDHYKPKINLYGGAADAALSANIYYSTGHYQEINTTILNSIKKDNKFEFNNIHIFGGDTHIALFDLQRIIRNRIADSADFFSHAMLFPIQSTVNTELRSGDHVNKVRSYNITNNPYGIGIRGSYMKLEDFNYNDGYSTSVSERFYLPLPYGFKESTEAPFDFVWSHFKTPGEESDSYRIFPVNNKRTVESTFGMLTGLIQSTQKIIYLQEKGIGYMPINERINIASAEFQPIQLGVGGTFDRYDTTNKFYGCQHYFSISKTPQGVVFFDFYNRAFVSLSHSLQLTDESIIKGLEPFFYELDDDLILNDNPFNGFGILSYYDKRRKEVVMVFKMPRNEGEYIAITYNDKRKIFTGTSDVRPDVVISNKGNTLSSIARDNDYDIYIHDINPINRSYYETIYNSYISFVVNNNPDDPKIFDIFKIIGNDKCFSKIKYIGENFEVEEPLVYNDNSLLSEYIKYLNFEWRGSYPLDSEGGRLRGHYVEVTLTVDNDNNEDVRLLKFITNNRKYR